jgi:exopolysaccharide production protein ExoZ
MSRLLTLQVVRGVAANLVVLQHLTEFEPRYAGTNLPPMAHYGDLGVDIFFVLSGFIMVAVAGRGISAPQFLWRRAARIYPTYWLATLIMLAAAVFVPGLVHESIASIPLWRSFLLVAASPEQPVVSVGWTLVHEIYFYLVFAIFLAVRIPFILGAIAWVAIIILARLILPDELMNSSPVLKMATSPLTFEFMMGLVIGVLWIERQPPQILVSAGAVAPIAFAVALLPIIAVHFYLFAHEVPTIGIIPFGDGLYSVLCRVLMFGIPIALLLYSLVTYEAHFPKRVPRLLVALGDWSYSVYLFHFMLLSALGRAVLWVFPGHGIIASITLFVAGFAVVNLAGSAVYVLFERPMLRWLHRLGPAIRRAGKPIESMEVEQIPIR